MRADEFGKHYAELATRDAAEQSRRLTLPAKADDVKVELPKDFTIPQGVEFAFDDKKPEFGQLRDWAVKHGVAQDAITDLVGIYAGVQLADRATVAQARADQIKQLGANGPARITALQTFFNGILGNEAAEHLTGNAKNPGVLWTSKIVESLEKVVAKFSGASSYSSSGRDAANVNGRVSEEEYNAMSPRERVDYARRFDQSKMPEWNRGGH